MALRMMKWTLILTPLLLTLCFKDVNAKSTKGRIFDYFGGTSGTNESDGIFVNNPVLDFLIFLAIVGGILIVIGIIMAAWKAVRGPEDPSERGLLDSESESGSDYNISSNKSGKHYGIANPEEIFTDTKNFVERAGDKKNTYQRMPETTRGDDRMDIDSSSHRMFDMFDRRQGARSQGGPSWGSNYQNIQEEPQNYYNSPGYYRN